MPDDTPIQPGTDTGDRVASDELLTLNGGATVADAAGRRPKAQRVKPGFGVDGDFRDVSSSSPFPVRQFDANGNQLTQQYGSMRVSPEPSGLFFDPLEALDSNRWTPSGTSPSFSNGQVTVAPGTAAGALSGLTSVPTFIQSPSVFLQVANAVRLEAAPVTGAHRFWGMGTAPATPTAAAPLTDAYGWELGTDGKLLAVVYASGVRTVIADLSATGAQKLDGEFHRYVVQFRSDRAFWFIDDMNVAVASASFRTPNQQQLPLRFQQVNGTSTLGAATTFVVQSTAITDTGSNNQQLSDGTYPFRKARVSRDGSLAVDLAPPGDQVSVLTAAAGVAVTTTEALIALAVGRNRAAPGTAAASNPVTASKTFRVKQFQATVVGTATAAARCTFQLRYNPTGAVAANSPVVAQVVVGAPAVQASTQILDFDEGLDLPGGTSPAHFGVTALASAATTGWASLYGYEL